MNDRARPLILTLLFNHLYAWPGCEGGPNRQKATNIEHSPMPGIKFPVVPQVLLHWWKSDTFQAISEGLLENESIGLSAGIKMHAYKLIPLSFFHFDVVGRLAVEDLRK